MLRFSPLALAGALLATSVTVIAASPSVAAPSVRVGYGDLDLASDADRAELGGRLDKAIASVCAQDDPRELNAMLACRRETRAQVHAYLSPALRGDVTQLALRGDTKRAALR